MNADGPGLARVATGDDPTWGTHPDVTCTPKRRAYFWTHRSTWARRASSLPQRLLALLPDQMRNVLRRGRSSGLSEQRQVFREQSLFEPSPLRFERPCRQPLHAVAPEKRVGGLKLARLRF